MEVGQIEAIYLSLDPVDEANGVAGRGLEGDRYFRGEGQFDRGRYVGMDITLIEQETLLDVELDGAASRRNIVTSGVKLNTLVDKRFQLGELVLLGRRLCDPCLHLQRNTRPGIMKALRRRGGLRADILVGGRIAIGDRLEELPSADVEITAIDAQTAGLEVDASSPVLIAGDHIYVSGLCVTHDPDSGELLTDMWRQLQATFEKIIGLLALAGASLRHVVQVRVVLTDLERIDDFEKIYSGYFGDPAPTRSVIGARLDHIPDALVMVDCTAYARNS